MQPQPGFIFYFMYLSVSLAYMSVYHMCAWCLGRPEEDIGSLGSAELNLGPLEDQPQFLIFFHNFLLLLRQGLTQYLSLVSYFLCSKG